ncbi:DUF6771 family protein [Sphingomonas nostoxanthinifaciens]|uniref:DUF6771 family protein n=1 Tax=Sphingomonas nostoxanthinifaciens TaxID=2872652 RepID=UPI0037D9A59D
MLRAATWASPAVAVTDVRVRECAADTVAATMLVKLDGDDQPAARPRARCSNCTLTD